MKLAALVVKRLAVFSNASFPGAKCSEIFRRFRHNIRSKLKLYNKKSYIFSYFCLIERLNVGGNAKTQIPGFLVKNRLLTNELPLPDEPY